MPVLPSSEMSKSLSPSHSPSLTPSNPPPMTQIDHRRAALCALKQGTAALERLIALEIQSQAGKAALAHGETALAHGKTALAHGKTALAHGETALAHGLRAVDDCKQAHESAQEGLKASKASLDKIAALRAKALSMKKNHNKENQLKTNA